MNDLLAVIHQASTDVPHTSSSALRLHVTDRCRPWLVAHFGLTERGVRFLTATRSRTHLPGPTHGADTGSTVGGVGLRRAIGNLGE